MSPLTVKENRLLGFVKRLFAVARLADEERRILHNLGYPHPPTFLLCDNECAVGLATKTMTSRLSKIICLRFHWLQDRIQRGQFCVQHVAGDVNIADFFTKALPRIKHAQFTPYCALDPAALGNGPLTLALCVLLILAVCTICIIKRVC